jgi:hypothetical protein
LPWSYRNRDGPRCIAAICTMPLRPLATRLAEHVAETTDVPVGAKAWSASSTSTRRRRMRAPNWLRSPPRRRRRRTLAAPLTRWRHILRRQFMASLARRVRRRSAREF